MKIRLKKVKDLDLKNPGIHPAGYIVQGDFVDIPKVGEVFKIGESFWIDGITEIVDSRHFKTRDTLFMYWRIIERVGQLEELCVSLEEAQLLNNKEDSHFAWVFNPYKNIDEFELRPVSQVISSEDGLHVVTKLEYSHVASSAEQKEKAKWKVFNADIFVGTEQINEMISKGEFYFAPLKKSPMDQITEAMSKTNILNHKK